MDDEAFELPKIPDLEKSPAFPPGHIHPFKNVSADTAFTRFIQKIGVIFSRPTPKNDLKLNGRIRELQTIASNIFFELLDLKKKIKQKIDPTLFSLFITILDPLIKEAGRVPPIAEKEDNTAQQVKMFSRYVDSIEKAKLWIEIGKTCETKEALEQSIIQQIAKEFLSRIDRDIQVTQDYLSHALSSFEMSDVLKNELQMKLMPDLSAKIFDLHALKKSPSDTSLSSFLQWRSNADLTREMLFCEALHIIDNFSDEFFPSPKETENEHSLAILTQLNEIEEKIKKVTFDIESVKELDENQKKAFLEILIQIEGEAHRLNSNLRLSHEHGERIEKSLETLLSLRHGLSS